MAERRGHGATDDPTSPRELGTDLGCGTRELRFHAGRLVAGLGARPSGDAGLAWDTRHRDRARFLVALAGWDHGLLRRASLQIVRAGADDSRVRTLLLAAAEACSHA